MRDSTSTRLRSARAVWLKVHLYLGLFGGAVLAITGLSGSVLVFQDRIDQLLHPALLSASATAHGNTARANLDDVVRSVTSEFRQRPAAIELARETVDVHIAHLPTAAGQLRLVPVDPASASILGERTWGKYPVSFVYELHQKLLLGSIGSTVVGCFAVIVIASVLTGLYLWWPRGRLHLTTLQRAFAFKWTRNKMRLNYDLHRVAGAYVAIVLLLAATTALYFSFPSQIASAISMVSHVRSFSNQPSSMAVAQGTDPITLEHLQHQIATHLKNAVPSLIYLPADARSSYRVRFRAENEVYTRHGQSFAWFDQYSGDLLAVQDYQGGTRGDRFLAWLLPLHTGEAAGIVGRVTVLIAGLVPTLLYITGFYVWIRRRRPRATSTPAPGASA